MRNYNYKDCSIANDAGFVSMYTLPALKWRRAYVFRSITVIPDLHNDANIEQMLVMY